MKLLDPIIRPQTPCKCCGDRADLFGVVDFNKNCEMRRQNVLPVSGIPIYYHRCGRCGLIFTIAFDEFTTADFLEQIYNQTYAIVDPEYAEIRPAGNARFLADKFAGQRETIRLLDYGGGNGRLAAILRGVGFTQVDTFDPFVAEHAARPQGRYDCIVCYEVVEHSNRPAETFGDIDSLLKEDGLILFSTLLQPPEMASLGMSWWYLSPRNGHVSLFTRPALSNIIVPLGYRWGSFNDGLHAASRGVPGFAKHFVKL